MADLLSEFELLWEHARLASKELKFIAKFG